ncbi:MULTISPECIES: plasmid partitioning protein RepB [Paracoccaceae]|uniref:plasmid partitioning protein RepB n=1 Tax=Paracoccaceae TaxID=31989 RepID=UPI001574E629|nr:MULTISPECIES: plasmid partitioning protein RepB [Paracoccaceae]MBJ2153073.1 plasmid partitioning protein RepB [Paracoccus sp. IB05]NTT88484.1 plasmid partitioning protein RepB [Tabrizicola sp. SY72]
MARKLFENIKAGVPSSTATDIQGHPVEETGQPRIRSARALRGGLLEMSANSIRDLDPSVIIEDGPRDRLALEEDAIQALAESIRQHGQQVPILVRPSAEPDRYRVVYGRRRIAAARMLGIPVKALVRSLDDEASVVAQGQENSLRVNPSFIEKAVFAGALRDAGYESGTIQDALGISRQALSMLTIVQQAIPLSVIEAIGPAHDIGRRRWMELADLARETGIDLIESAAKVRARLDKEPSSDRRFEIILASAKIKPTGQITEKSTPVSVSTEDGTKLGQVRRSGHEVLLALSGKDAPEFCAWVEQNAPALIQQLHSQWRATSKPEE